MEEKLRNQIKGLVEQYYREVHKKSQDAPFVPGESKVSYAGRVFDEKEMLNLTDSLLDFWLTAGRFCEAFETKLAEKLGVKHALLVNSGSSANLVAFNALTSKIHGAKQILKGDEVITVAAGFPTTVNPTIQYGAVPVFLDITYEDGTYDVDVNQLDQALTKKTKAVMIAHTLGNPFNIDAVKNFCDTNNLWLVEDNCDALGSEYAGKMTGTFGHVGTSSFYPPHHLTMGEGGAVYTSNPFVKKAAESMRDWGRDCWCASGKDNTCKKRFDWKLGGLPKGYDHKYTYSHFGYNLKATEMQASIGLAQLDKLDHFTELRRQNFKRLYDGMKDLEQYFYLPKATPKSNPSWFGFLLTLKEGVPFARTELTRFLEDNKIQTRMLFAGNLIRQPAFDEMRKSGEGYRVIGDLKNTDYVLENTFWLGVYPGIRPEMIDYICEVIHKFVKSKS